jgi:dTDP-glucose pyrophosphorylase
MIKQPSQHTIVVHETNLRPVDRCQQIQKRNSNELEMTDVMNLMLDQIININQITQLKERNILNPTRKSTHAEILEKKNIADQNLLLSRRERITIDKLESENRSRRPSMTYCPMTKT